MWDTLLEFLQSLSNGPLRYTYADVFRTVIALAVAGVLAYFDSDSVTKKIVYGLYIIAIPLIIHDLLNSKINILSLSMGVNVLFATVIAKMLYQKYLISETELHLFIAISLFIPTYPLATAFPLSRSPLSWPFASFTLTILLYIGLISLVFVFRNLAQNQLREVESPHISASAFGSAFSASNVGSQTGRLFAGEEPRLLGPVMTTTDIEEYLAWHNTNMSENDVETVAEIEQADFKRFLSDALDAGSEVDSQIAEHYDSFFSELVGSEYVWVSSFPSFTRLLAGALALALIFGSPVPL